MASGGFKSNKPELVAIYRLEFYKNKRKWKFSNEKIKESSLSTGTSQRVERQGKDSLNETYNVDPGSDWEKEDSSPLNNAFIHEIPTDDTPEDDQLPSPSTHQPSEGDRPQQAVAPGSKTPDPAGSGSVLYEAQTGIASTHQSQTDATQRSGPPPGTKEPDINLQWLLKTSSLPLAKAEPQNRQQTVQGSWQPENKIWTNQKLPGSQQPQSQGPWVHPPPMRSSSQIKPQNVPPCGVPSTTPMPFNHNIFSRPPPMLFSSLQDKEMSTGLLKSQSERNIEIEPQAPPDNCLQMLLCPDKWNKSAMPNTQNYREQFSTPATKDPINGLDPTMLNEQLPSNDQRDIQKISPDCITNEGKARTIPFSTIQRLSSGIMVNKQNIPPVDTCSSSIPFPENLIDKQSIPLPDIRSNKYNMPFLDTLTNKQGVLSSESGTNKQTVPPPDIRFNKNCIPSQDMWTDKQNIELPDIWTNTQSVLTPNNYTNKQSTLSPATGTDAQNIPSLETWTNKQNVPFPDPCINFSQIAPYLQTLLQKQNIPCPDTWTNKLCIPPPHIWIDQPQNVTRQGPSNFQGSQAGPQQMAPLGGTAHMACPEIEAPPPSPETFPEGTWYDVQMIQDTGTNPAQSSNLAALQRNVWTNGPGQKEGELLQHRNQELDPQTAEYAPNSADGDSCDPYSAVDQNTLKPGGGPDSAECEGLAPEQIRQSTELWLRRLLRLYRPGDDAADCESASDQHQSDLNESTDFIREAHEVPHSSEKDPEESPECVCMSLPRAALPALSSRRLDAALRHVAIALRGLLREKILRDRLRIRNIHNMVEYPTRDTGLFGSEYAAWGPRDAPGAPPPVGPPGAPLGLIKIDMGRPRRL